jgi:hypothetical protein
MYLLYTSHTRDRYKHDFLENRRLLLQVEWEGKQSGRWSGRGVDVKREGEREREELSYWIYKNRSNTTKGDLKG